MQDFDLNTVAAAGLVALTLGGAALAGAAPAVAADLAPYVTEQGAVLERPPVRRRIVVEENDDAPPIEHRVIERRVVERRIVDGFEGPALVPQPDPPVVSVHESEGYEGPALVPPQDVPVVPVEAALPSHVHRQRIVRLAPAEECRVVVTKRIDAFGEVVLRRTRICD